MSSYFIGVDIGTGSTKAVAINETANRVLLTRQIAYPTIHPSYHASEQSPEIIWQAFVKSILQTILLLKEAPEAIGISSAMHSLIPVDNQGVALMNMITWADGRSADIAEQLKISSDAEEIYTTTGTPIHAMSPLCKIMWLRNNRSEIFKKTYKFISIKEYIWHKLFNEFEVDYSIASGTGLFDIKKLKWHPSSLSIAGICETHLSKPVPTTYARADINEQVGKMLQLNSSTSFVIGATDGCLANLGSNAIAPGIASLTIGTSGAIRTVSSTPRYNFESMTFNYILDEKNFVCGGPVNNGGAVWNWYVNNLLDKEIMDHTNYDALLSETVKISPGANGLIFLPYLMGERAPIWNSKSYGVFFGISINHKQPHFTKAIIEGISLALYSVGLALEEASGNIEKLYVSGGFTHSTIWVQLIADVFGKDVFFSHSEDASALGAALMAIKAIRKEEHYLAFSVPEEEKIHLKPNKSKTEHYKNLYPVFRRLYDKLKDEMNTIYQLNNN